MHIVERDDDPGASDSDQEDRTNSRGQLAKFDPEIVHGRWRILVWCVVATITGLSGLSYSWGIAHSPLEPFYEAAVRSMAMNWHNFFYGAFDPAGTVTIDKLPGAFWLQALSVRVFGDHTWAMILPQVVGGMLTVVFLFRAVERLMGTVVGLIAASVLAASPATVALDRGNISDTTMVLFLVLAANSLSSAIKTGRQRSLIWVGVWIGFAFQAKMMQAWLVLPAMGLAYLLGSSNGLTRKLRQLLVGGLVAAVVSLSWMTVVTLTPASSRPYVDGSHDNSVYEQVFVYNGFGRFGQKTPLQLLAGQNLPVPLGPPPSPARLLHGDFGRDTGFLLPTALVVGLAGLFTRRRSFFVLWTGWLATLAAAFSQASTINSYYTAALSPPIAATLAGGAICAWTALKHARADPEPSGRSRSLIIPTGVAVLVVGTVTYGIWLIHGREITAPGWLAPLAICVGVVAVVFAALAAIPTKRKWLAIGSILTGIAAILIIPAAGSGQLVAQHRSFGDTPFESKKTAAALNALLVGPQTSIGGFARQLRPLEGGSPWLMAMPSSAAASVFIDASGREVLPIGGFTGTIPEPTIEQLASYVRQGKFHLVLALGKSHLAAMVWIRGHCQPVGGGVLYLCSPSDAPAP